MNSSFLATTVPLCRVKLRIFINTLRAKVTGKKAVLLIFGALCIIFFVAVSVSDLLAMFETPGVISPITEWIVGLIALYAIIFVFSVDLLTGHTLNAGQMSSDFDYLMTLPITPGSLFCVKTFERFASDYIGAMVLLTGFIAVTCRNDISAAAIVISLVLFAQTSVLLGTLINLIMLALRRYLATSSINNFFSVFGYLSAFFIVTPYLLISNSSQYSAFAIIDLLNRHQGLLKLLTPARWLGASLLNATAVTEFWQFSGLWLVIMLFCGLLLYRSLNSGVLAIRKTRTNRKRQNGKKWFSGLMQKDYLLLQSDYNIRINSFIMPITLILLNVLLIGHSSEFKTFSMMLTMIYGGIVYFCMFGPTNAIGSEGRTIALLESLPMHPQQILKDKFKFWLTTASTLMIPLTIGVFWYHDFTFIETAEATLLTFSYTCACVWTTLQLSAIFPVFDSKVLQQSSSVWAKAGAFFLMMILLPVRDFSLPNCYNLLIFIMITVILNMKARTTMFYRLEENQHNNHRQHWFNYMLLALSFLGAEATIKQTFLGLAPGVNTGLWSWVLPLLVTTPILLLTIIFNQRSSEKRATTGRIKQPWAKTTAATVFMCGSGAWASWAFINHDPILQKFLHNEFIYFAEIIEKTGLSFNLSAFFGGAIPVLAAATATFLAIRFILQSNENKQYLRGLITLAILPPLAPSQLLIPAIVVTTMIWLHCRFFATAVGAALIAAASVALPAILLFN